MSIEDLRLSEDSTSFLTIFGNPGTGKTKAACEMAPRTALLTDENGWKVLPNNHPELWKRVVPIRYKGLSSFGEAIRGIKSEPDPSQWQLVIDTLTAVQQKRIAVILDEVKLNRDHPEIPSLQDYLLSQKEWTPIIEAFTTCGINITVICHVRLPGEKPKPGETTRPALTDAVFKVVNANSNVVAYMKKDSTGKKRSFTTQGTISLTAKDQTSVEERDIPDDLFIERVLKTRGYL